MQIWKKTADIMTEAGSSKKNDTATFKFIKETGTVRKGIRNAIEKIEVEYNISFPGILKDYYSKYNDAKISLITVDIKGYKCEVAKIIPLVGEGLSFEKIVQNDRADGFLPNTYYPLARDRGGGNYYYWDSKTYNVFFVLSDNIDNPLCVAKSLKEFMDKLNEGFQSTSKKRR